MYYRNKLMQATELLQQCADRFGAFVNGLELAGKETDALRRDIAVFLDGTRAASHSPMRDLLLLARAEVYHNPECVPGGPCRCENGELMRRIDAALEGEPRQGDIAQARMAELRKDAERYRKLRDGQRWPAVFACSDAAEPLRGADLDAAIDGTEPHVDGWPLWRGLPPAA